MQLQRLLREERERHGPRKRGDDNEEQAAADYERENTADDYDIAHDA